VAIVDFISSFRSFDDSVRYCGLQWSRLPQERWKNGFCYSAWHVESDEHVPRLSPYSYSEIKTLQFLQAVCGPIWPSLSLGQQLY